MSLVKSASVAILAAASLAMAAPAAALTLTNGALFRAEADGNNQNTTNGGSTVGRGGWSTVLNQQNVAGNYGAMLFLSLTADPEAGDFVSPSANLQLALKTGENRIYFWGDGDDTAGGDDAFGLNLFFAGAAANAPLISALRGTPGALSANAATTCTAGYDFSCVDGSGLLVGAVGGVTVTLTDFVLSGLGGGAGGEDRVNHDNTQPFAFPPHANGVNDTYGYFTLDVQGVPEPGTWALMIAGFGLAGASLRRRRLWLPH